MAVWNEEETLKLKYGARTAIQAMLGVNATKTFSTRFLIKWRLLVTKKTADQCNNKIRKLKLEYRRIKDSRKKTGTGRKDWRYFEEMDAVLGHKPATQLL